MDVIKGEQNVLCENGFLTFRVFVQVCDVLALVRANSLGANAASHDVLLYVNLRESAIRVPLPVDLIAVHLKGHAAF